MNDFLLDFLVNTFEALCVYIFIMSCFRFPIRSHLIHAVIASAIIAQTSFVMRFQLHLDRFTPLLMLIWFIILIWLLFRVHPFYSLLMTVTGYLSYVVIQTLLLQIFQFWFPIEVIVSPLLHAKMFQTLAAVLTLVLALWLDRRRIGFSFVPETPRVKVQLTGSNLILFSISIIGCLLISGVAYYLVKGGLLATAIGALCLLIILFFFNVAYKKEINS